MIIRYFIIPSNQIKGYKAELYPDNNDVSPITNLKVLVNKYPCDDGCFIVKADITDYLIKALSDGLDTENPLTVDGLIELDIVDSFAGDTKEEVLARWPELSEQVQVGINEDGHPIMENKWTIGMWAGELKE